MFPPEYKYVVAEIFVNESALPATGKSWKAKPAVLRTQWEIFLGGIWSAKRHPLPEICLGKICVPLTPAPRSCGCKRKELTKEAGICGTLLHSLKELDKLWVDSMMQIERILNEDQRSSCRGSSNYDRSKGITGLEMTGISFIAHIFTSKCPFPERFHSEGIGLRRHFETHHQILMMKIINPWDSLCVFLVIGTC